MSKLRSILRELVDALIDRDEDPSLGDTLTVLGYTHEHVSSGIRRVCKDGVQVFRGRCWECWAWLRASGHDV